MTVQITDEQLSRLQDARSAIRNAISRNRVRFIDVELLTAGRALDEVLAGSGSQSEQNQDPAVATSAGPQL